MFLTQQTQLTQLTQNKEEMTNENLEDKTENILKEDNAQAEAVRSLLVIDDKKENVKCAEKIEFIISSTIYSKFFYRQTR